VTDTLILRCPSPLVRPFTDDDDPLTQIANLEAGEDTSGDGKPDPGFETRYFMQGVTAAELRQRGWLDEDGVAHVRFGLIGDSGTMLQTQIYLATDAPPLPRFTYTGQQYDAESEMYAMGSGLRFMDPGSGRFNQQDPAREGTNHSVYVFNDPVNLWDPSGMAAYGGTPSLRRDAGSPSVSPGGSGLRQAIFSSLTNGPLANAQDFHDVFFSNPATDALPTSITNSSGFSDSLEHTFGKPMMLPLPDFSRMSASAAYAVAWDHIGANSAHAAAMSSAVVARQMAIHGSYGLAGNIAVAANEATGGFFDAIGLSSTHRYGYHANYDTGRRFGRAVATVAPFAADLAASVVPGLNVAYFGGRAAYNFVGGFVNQDHGQTMVGALELGFAAGGAIHTAKAATRASASAAELGYFHPADAARSSRIGIDRTQNGLIAGHGPSAAVFSDPAFGGAMPIFDATGRPIIGSPNILSAAKSDILAPSRRTMVGGGVYILSDANTGLLLKAGRTQSFARRASDYLELQRLSGRSLLMERFHTPPFSHTGRSLIERQMRLHLKSLGHTLPWDLTGGTGRIKDILLRNPRFGD
jgi:RHS repeat-associated protein